MTNRVKDNNDIHHNNSHTASKDHDNSNRIITFKMNLIRTKYKDIKHLTLQDPDQTTASNKNNDSTNKINKITTLTEEIKGKNLTKGKLTHP